MWTRKELKEKAKIAFKANYLICVAVALVLCLLTAGEGSSAKAGNDNDTTVESSDLSAIEEFTTTMQEEGILGLVLGAIGVGVVLSIAIKLFVKNIITVGIADFYMENANSPAKFMTIFNGYKNGFGTKALAMFLRDLFTSLWTLLFIIPGIVKAYEYRMIPYILSDKPELTWKEAFAESKRLMSGNKMKAFMLDLSFIGWMILSIIPLVAVLWTMPYYESTCAELYLALKEEN